jgi:hypothetical protein
VEGALKNLLVKEETHGFTVYRHLNWDDFNWVAITPKGSVVVFRDRTDWTLYAVYSSVRGRYHVHIPYDSEIIALDERVNEVLREVFDCLHHAECYVDRTVNVIYSINKFRIGFIPFGMVSYTKL